MLDEGRSGETPGPRSDGPTGAAPDTSILPPAGAIAVSPLDPSSPSGPTGRSEADLPVHARPDPSTPPYGMPVVRVDDPVTGDVLIEPDLATLNARLGLLASLSGFAFALPAVAILKLGGAPSVLWSDLAVFAAAAVAGIRLPVLRRVQRRQKASASGVETAERPVRQRGSPSSPSCIAPDVDEHWVGDEEDLAAFLPHGRHRGDPGPDAHVGAEGPGRVPHLSLRLRPPARRRRHLVVRPRPRRPHRRGPHRRAARRADPPLPQRTADADRRTVAGGGFAALGAFFTERVFLAVVALAVGAAGAVAKPSFDALVQRHVRESNQGRAFARFETRFQLMWVVGSLVPVVLSLSLAGRVPGHRHRRRRWGPCPT